MSSAGAAEGCRRLRFCQSVCLSSFKSQKPTEKEKIWKQNAADPEYTFIRRPKGKLFDKRTLYSIKKENVASRELKSTNRPLYQQEEKAQACTEQTIERNYINNTRLPDITMEKFPKVILQRLLKHSGLTSSPSYGTPQPEAPAENPYKILVNDLYKDPRIVRIDKFPSLMNPLQCQNCNDFCQILGPSVCSRCIENTDRYIGEKLLYILFPTIQTNTEQLVVPNLSKVLREGHKLQIRNKRMRELGIKIPAEFWNLRRKETHLSSSACLKCKKQKLPVKEQKMLCRG